MNVSKKQFYLLTAGLLIVCLANAQIKKGDILLGGNVGFSRSSVSPHDITNTPSQTTFSIAPSIGKAVSDNLVVGLNLGFNYFKSKNGDPAVVNTNDIYGLGVFVRKYKMLGAGFALFAEGDLSGNYELTNSYADGGPKPKPNKYYTINAGFYPGVAYFISRHVQLETGIQNLAYAQYGHATSGEGVNEQKTNLISVGTNLSQAFDNLLVGVRWLL